jgi:hypothetical protein
MTGKVLTPDQIASLLKPASVDIPASTETSAGVGEHDSYPRTTYELTWCEFCKGNYIAEFHFGDKGGET